ncbi:uncharacterized protein METZ01_LOCUS183669 [marine metagenome]|uniref:Uncharacterized protein n=1 Tax=marine metagenome TaxID=408172 RepID=A0A382CXK7_9ZZZZ
MARMPAAARYPLNGAWKPVFNCHDNDRVVPTVRSIEETTIGAQSDVCGEACTIKIIRQRTGGIDVLVVPGQAKGFNGVTQFADHVQIPV